MVTVGMLLVRAEVELNIDGTIVFYYFKMKIIDLLVLKHDLFCFCENVN